jgi:hypothetical protein
VVAELALLAVAYELYSWTRLTVVGASAAARAHAHELIRTERLLGLLQEPRVQRAFLDLHHPTLLQAMNVYYGSAHFVVPVVVLVALWRTDPERYRFWRNAFGFMLLFALIGFTWYPLAPPRLAHDHLGMVDVSSRYSLPGFRPGSDGSDNPYAAMPSLHVGWSAWCCLATFAITRRWRWRTVAMAYPLLTLLVVVVTGNHYVLDAVGGAACLLAGMLASVAVERVAEEVRRRRRSTASAT